MHNQIAISNVGTNIDVSNTRDLGNRLEAIGASGSILINLKQAVRSGVYSLNKVAERADSRGISRHKINDVNHIRLSRAEIRDDIDVVIGSCSFEYKDIRSRPDRERIRPSPPCNVSFLP